MSKTELRLDLLGTSLLLSVDDEDRVYLETLRTRFIQKVEEVHRKYNPGDPLKTALVTGFLLCDELERLRAYSMSAMAPKDFIQVEQITTDLIEQIENILPDDYKGQC